MVDVVLPELGEGIEKATVSYWHVQVGDAINEGDDLVELTTDKATFNVPAPASGKVAAILKEEGDEIKVGEALARIEE
jgi:pyruvate dehydrogenase E2 component (dihydrolipoamide acetyltransferase)